MLFNSYLFILGFLPIVLLGFYWLSKANQRLAAVWLAVASIVFYGWWDVRYVPLLLGSIVFNFFLGSLIGRSRSAVHSTHGANRSRAFLIVAICANLALLGYFKYVDFFVANLNGLAGTSFRLQDIALPLGISFFTFTQIAFLVDTYSGKVSEYDFVHYTLFVTYFPHLIAGPVLHHKEMMPQFKTASTYVFNRQNVIAGLSLFVLGLAKKVLLADSFAEYSTPVFDAVAAGGSPQLIEAWVGALAYTFQLYFDFSGYSDMAIGLSLLFNVKLPLNFNSPYKALSIIEFWRRWHMTLSRFLRDYLYIPLGGSRSGPTSRYFNLMVTMLLGGLWHGAGWTFVFWGGLHGAYLMVNHGWRALKARLGLGDGGRWAQLAAGVLTFVCVVFAWVFFRADSFSTAMHMVSGMVGLNGIALPNALAGLSGAPAGSPVGGLAGGPMPLTRLNFVNGIGLLLLGMAVCFWCPNACELVNRFREFAADLRHGARGRMQSGLSDWLTKVLALRQTRLQGACYGSALFLLLMYIGAGGKSEFLYFQF